MACRTSALGGQSYRCGDCGRRHVAWHSCNHRSCPQCGGGDAQAWLERNRQRLLPVPHFMVTFTVPEEVRALALREPEVVYRALMREAAGTLQDVLRSKLGAEAGFLGVLHTWTRDLRFHPHVHFIVPGGVLSEDGLHWRRLKNEAFLVHVDVLSKRFRTRMRAALGDLAKEIPVAAWQKQWVVHSQPAGSGEEVLRYLSAYVFRTAISERNILREEDGQITFSYKPGGSQIRTTCTLPVVDFLKRILLHVLPKGLHKIGYFGWMHPRAKKRLERIRSLLETPLVLGGPPEAAPPTCPHCGHASLVRIGTIKRLWLPHAVYYDSS